MPKTSKNAFELCTTQKTHEKKRKTNYTIEIVIYKIFFHIENVAFTMKHNFTFSVSCLSLHLEGYNGMDEKNNKRENIYGTNFSDGKNYSYFYFCCVIACFVTCGLSLAAE